MSTVRLHHQIDGQPGAPPLVLGPSLGTSTLMWDPNVSRLAERFRVVRVDFRGQGASPVPAGPYEIEDLALDVIALLDELELPQVSFAGVSIGGMVGMWLATHKPERIDRLALICTAAQLGPPERWQDRAKAVREANSTEPIADAVVARWITDGYKQRHPEVYDRLRALIVSSPAEGYAECCGAVERMDQRESIKQITAPTIVIGGADDEATPTEHQELIAANIPGAHLVVLPDAAHLANVEQPDAVTELIIEHVEREGPE